MVENLPRLWKLFTIPKTKTGTKVTACWRDDLFSTTDFKYNTISERLSESAFTLKNVTLSLTDKRTDEAIEFHYENEGYKTLFPTSTNKSLDASPILWRRRQWFPSGGLPSSTMMDSQ